MRNRVPALERWHRSTRRRLTAVAPLLLILAAAAPRTTPPPAYTPAPVPHWDIDVPLDDSTPETKIRPHFFSALDTGSFRGDGFTPGSTVTANEEEHWVRPTPGVSVSVPLQ